MKKTTLLALLFITTLLFSTSFSMKQAKAGILLEPYIGQVIQGSGSSGYASTSNWEHEYTGLIYGGRAGVVFSGLMLGGEYSMQSFEMSSKSGSTTYKDDIAKKQSGLFVGYHFPMHLRLWGTYFLQGEIKGESSPGTHLIDNKSKYNQMSGYGAGISYVIANIVGLNLEYRTMKYKQYIYDGYSYASVYSKKLTVNEILLSASLPLVLFGGK
ncbi:MAG: outer membrane beta-barrel protein [Oligoflexia bacterium]|nr:outer membrane beta-barrel protein [Oligoflexia bacterium]